MNIEKLEAKLIAAGRKAPLSSHVPHAFEKRILARIKESAVADALWLHWGRMLWRATAPCAAVMIAFSVWTFYTTQGSRTELNLEDAVLAPVHLADNTPQ